MERVFIPRLINRQIQWFELVCVRSYCRWHNGHLEYVRAYQRRVNRVSRKLYQFIDYQLLLFQFCLIYFTKPSSKRSSNRYKNAESFNPPHFCYFFFFEPKTVFRTILPTFRSNPCLVIGIPVFRLIFCLAAVIPTALFREKLNPGIFILVLLTLYKGSRTQLPLLPKTET